MFPFLRWPAFPAAVLADRKNVTRIGNLCQRLNGPGSNLASGQRKRPPPKRGPLLQPSNRVSEKEGEGTSSRLSAAPWRLPFATGPDNTLQAACTDQRAAARAGCARHVQGCPWPTLYGRPPDRVALRMVGNTVRVIRVSGALVHAQTATGARPRREATWHPRRGAVVARADRHR